MLFIALDLNVKFNLIFDDPLGNELSKEAKLRGITIEELVEEILEEYVKTENGVIV
tara:strand:+ start:100 stop:267 length:168 start_codon:yes stop_codon:yes gene_type:complete